MDRTDELQKAFSYRWLIFVILALAYLFVYFHRTSLSVVAEDLVKDFNSTASVIGLLGSIYFYCYAAMQLPAGLLSDSIGPRKTVTFFLLLAAGGSVLFGLASSLGVAFGARVLVGFGVSMVFIPTMKILSQWYRKTEFAFMAGLLNAVGGMGVLAATWILALMAEAWGWRYSFELIGVLTVVIVILVWLIVRDRPQSKGWPSIQELDQTEPPATIPLGQGVKRVVKNRYFWPLAIWFFFDCGVFFGFGALWSGPYLMHLHGFSRAESGAILSMTAWGMIIGSPLLGFLSDKILKSRKKVIQLCTAILVLDILALYLGAKDIPIPLLYLIFFVFSVCSSSIVVIGFTSGKELFPVEMAGTSVGTVNLFPFLGGAVFMPLLGKILDAHPQVSQGVYSPEAYSSLLLVLLISCLAALGCSFLMKETY